MPTNELMVITSVLSLDTSKIKKKKKKKIKALIVMSSLFTFILHDFSAKSGKCGSIIVAFGRGLNSLLCVH